MFYVANAWKSQGKSSELYLAKNANSYFDGTRGENRAELPNTGDSRIFMTILADLSTGAGTPYPM